MKDSVSIKRFDDERLGFIPASFCCTESKEDKTACLSSLNQSDFEPAWSRFECGGMRRLFNRKKKNHNK